MNVPERLIPALVMLLLVAVLAPLCAAAGLDGCGDSCCEVAAHVSSGVLARVASLLATVLGAAALVLVSESGTDRTVAAGRPGSASSATLCSLPLRI